MYRKINTYNGGFSLTELLVVTAIFVTITTIGLFSYNQFNSRTLLDSLAYDVALSIKETQQYGISVKDAAGLGFDIGYGIYFDQTDLNSYILFTDIPNPTKNHIYDGDLTCAPATECLDRFTFGNRYSISDVCAILPGGASSRCMTSGASDLTHLAVVFDRPDPDANFTSNFSGEVYEEIRITIKSAKGLTQDVFVVSTGQISVGEGASVSSVPPTPQCDDGVDNDGDGPVDLADPSCSDATDDDEASPAQCDDSIDNDGDFLVDFPADPNCADPSDNVESFSVICSELYRQGLVSEEVYKAESAYGRGVNSHVMKGYQLWARPVVRLMQKSDKVTAVVHTLVSPFIKQVAYEMGVLDQGSVIGKVMMLVGEPVSGVIGYVYTVLDNTQTKLTKGR